MNQDEVRVFALHLTQDNPLEKLMTQQMVKIIKKYKGAIAPTKDLMKYFVSLIFLIEKDRDDCAKEIEEIGLSVEKDNTPCYMDKAYIDALI